MIISIDWWFQHVSTRVFFNWKEARHRNGRMILRDPVFSRGLEPSKQSSEYVYILYYIILYIYIYILYIYIYIIYIYILYIYIIYIIYNIYIYYIYII